MNARAEAIRQDIIRARAGRIITRTAVHVSMSGLRVELNDQDRKTATAVVKRWRRGRPRKR